MSYITKVQHAYAKGDKVRVTNHKHPRGAKGKIVALMPWTLVAPAYYVQMRGSVIAVSERSLEKVEKQA